ncbi:purine permease 1-like [Euphorbia lathyris]|uniref:purine permease 1-like n=1 Tax=Euphorbia lathyris TaxID=212925 RepID=UPI00331355BA
MHFNSICYYYFSSSLDQMKKSFKKLLLLLNCILLFLGGTGGPLVMRLYFLKGGNGVWISSAMETAGFPFMLLSLFISYLHRRKKDNSGSQTKLFYITTRIFLASAVLGLLTGLDDFLYTYGVARLPITTSGLIYASQLGFTAGFAFLLVKQKFTSYSINAVFLLSLGSVILAFHSSSDRPNNESNREYFMGFIMTVVASALYGFVLPAIELVYKKANQNITYTLVMEMQMVMSFFATGMLLHSDFTGMEREANEFELGKSKYATIIFSLAVLWQCFFMGAIGVIFCGSTLLSGIAMAALLPVMEILAVFIYDETFRVEKGLSLVLSIWGFISYFYGEYKQSKINNQASELDIP